MKNEAMKQALNKAAGTPDEEEISKPQSKNMCNELFRELDKLDSANGSPKTVSALKSIKSILRQLPETQKKHVGRAINAILFSWGYDLDSL